MEATMHGSFDRSGETADQSIYRGWRIGAFVLPVLLVAVLIGLAITHPDVSSWISEAEQAEFANSTQLPGVAPAQVAQPATEIRTVKAN
jgi:hypothetical protein